MISSYITAGFTGQLTMMVKSHGDVLFRAGLLMRRGAVLAEMRRPLIYSGNMRGYHLHPHGKLIRDYNDGSYNDICLFDCYTYNHLKYQKMNHIKYLKSFPHWIFMNDWMMEDLRQNMGANATVIYKPTANAEHIFKIIDNMYS